MKNNILSLFFKLLTDEFNKSEGYNKYLILALIVNLPFPWVFIPYGTQAITTILLILYIKQIIKVINTNQINIKLFLILPSVIGIITQLFWFPYITQFYSLIIIGLQLVLVR